MDTFREAFEIYDAGVKSVLPDRLIHDSIFVNKSVLLCQNVSYKLADFDAIYLIGFGKAAASMALAMENQLGEWLTGGYILTKYHHSVPLLKCTLCEAGHPLPDQNGIVGARQISNMVSDMKENKLIIALISGGGSSLLADLPAGIQLSELISLNKLLVNSGANISEINTVRKHCSLLKGGQLARLSYPATLLTLLISDVVGDPLDVIASGPTVPDPTTFRDALRVVDKYQLQPLIAPSILDYLQGGLAGKNMETAKADNLCFNRTQNFLLGNNFTALEHAKNKAIMLGYDTFIFAQSFESEVEEVADLIYSKITFYLTNDFKQKIALLFGGEPTVHPIGTGKGGRNQHLTLLLSEKIAGLNEVTFLSAGTDGTDGPTDATGAICDGKTKQKAENIGLIPSYYTANFDSYSFFEKVGGQIKTGPTFTNVMDLMIVLINK
jgi:hydroxypyruvate reductase/glycerate 2-kinase